MKKFIIEEEFKNTLEDLAQLVQENLGGTYKISVLDINNKEVDIMQLTRGR